MTSDEGKEPVNTSASGIPAGGAGQGPPSGLPARGTGTRPPFPPAHELSTRHGAYSIRKVRAEAETLLTELRGTAPWVADIDAAALVAWASAEARCRLLRRWLDQQPLLDPDDKPWPAETLLLQWEKRAASARGTLGFDPLSRARLGKDSAIAQATANADLARLHKQGAKIMAARAAEAELEAAPTEDHDNENGEDDGGSF